MGWKLALVAALTITAASAQTWEVAPVAGYLRLSKKAIGSLNDSDPKTEDTSLHSIQPAYGVRLTLNTAGYYGVEASYIRSKERLDTLLLASDGKTRVPQSGNLWLNQASLNGISYFMPRKARFRPFMTAGFHVANFGVPRIPNWPARSSRKLGLNYGGVVKIRLFNHALMRFDVRDIITGAPYDLRTTQSVSSLSSIGRFRQLEGTVGIGFTF